MTSIVMFVFSQVKVAFLTSGFKQEHGCEVAAIN